MSDDSTIGEQASTGGGRQFLITGASSGIGRATAVMLAGRGHGVWAGVRNIADAPEHGNIHPVRLDVTDPGSIAEAVRVVGPLDGLVNNAGTAVGGPLEYLPIDRLRQQFEINTVGTMAVTQAFLPTLRSTHGRIVTVSSIGGVLSTSTLGAYSASKFAVEALMDALRRELSPWGLPVVLVQPGMIITASHDKTTAQVDHDRANWDDIAEQRYGATIDRLASNNRELMRKGSTPDEVATVIVLALTTRSPRSRYLVGANARVTSVISQLLPTRMVDVMLARTSAGSTSSG